MRRAWQPQCDADYGAQNVEPGSTPVIWAVNEWSASLPQHWIWCEPSLTLTCNKKTKKNTLNANISPYLPAITYMR